MSYWLGIDVGITVTIAAICREEAGRRMVPEVVPLGNRSAGVSSVVYLGQEGQVVVGEAAERCAVTNPDRVVREFVRRIGDEVPTVIDNVPHSAPEIAAMVIRWVVDRVAQREGGPAAGIVITHPAGWDAYKIQVMADALRATGLPDITFRTEPEAAAAGYAIQERIEIGSTIAVYDLGGATFDAAVVRKTRTGTFSVLGLPERIERLGGADFDQAVFGHVVAAVPGLSELDPEAAATPAETARLRRSFALCRQECTEAKEALSADTEVTIPVLFPEILSQVPLDREEFEDLIRPRVAETVGSLRRALRSAGVTAADLDAVLLVGGCARVPLVAQLVSAALACPIAVDADPQAAIALGAALSGLPADIAHPDGIDADADVPQDPPIPAAIGATSAGGFIESDVPEPAQADVPNPPLLTAIPLDVEAAELEWRRVTSPRLKWFAAASILALVLVGGAASVLFVTFHRGPLPAATTVGTQAPTTPAAPVTATPAPNLGSGNDNSPSGGAIQTTPTAAPDAPASDTATPETAAVPARRTSRPTTSRPTNRSVPPTSTTPPPQDLPDWVKEARNGRS